MPEKLHYYSRRTARCRLWYPLCGLDRLGAVCDRDLVASPLKLIYIPITQNFPNIVHCRRLFRECPND